MKISGAIEFEITEHSADRVVAEMPIGERLLNPYGVVNAGAILWLADVAASILVMGETVPSEGMKGFPLAINLNAHFLGNQTSGLFLAVAGMVRRGKTISIVRTTVTGAAGRQIAEVTTSHIMSK